MTGQESRNEYQREAQHTPGPWRLEAGRTIVTSSGAFYLAYGSDAHTSLPHFTSPTELDANARLIAAAPDLLAALEAVDNVIELVECGDPQCSDASPCEGRIVRAAIAQATGRGE